MFSAQTPNYGDRRPTMIVLHGTEVDDSLARPIFEGKTAAQGSCHYYIDAKGEIVQYLDETARAWHAGISYWAGFTDINSMSVGIELEAISHCRKFKGDETVYTAEQMNALIPLVKDIQTRHNIAPWNVVAHQDVSCTRPFDPQPAASLDEMLANQPVGQQRKYDPGPKFDWKLLAENGVGLWHNLEPEEEDWLINTPDLLDVFHRNLAAYGYDMRKSGEAHGHQHAIRAFQTHFLPWCISGTATEQSAKAIETLLTLKMS